VGVSWSDRSVRSDEAGAPQRRKRRGAVLFFPSINI
jgi:hypothetical protein